MSFICSGCRRPTSNLFAQPEGGGCLCQGCNQAASSRREVSALRSEIVALRRELGSRWDGAGTGSERS